MLKNTQVNRLATKKVATALGEFNEQVVYVGGAVVSLYIDDPAAEDVRSTLRHVPQGMSKPVTI